MHNEDWEHGDVQFRYRLKEDLAPVTGNVGGIQLQLSVFEDQPLLQRDDYVLTITPPWGLQPPTRVITAKNPNLRCSQWPTPRGHLSCELPAELPEDPVLTPKSSFSLPHPLLMTSTSVPLHKSIPSESLSTKL